MGTPTAYMLQLTCQPLSPPAGQAVSTSQPSHLLAGLPDAQPPFWVNSPLSINSGVIPGVHKEQGHSQSWGNPKDLESPHQEPDTNQQQSNEYPQIHTPYPSPNKEKIHKQGHCWLSFVSLFKRFIIENVQTLATV